MSMTRPDKSKSTFDGLGGDVLSFLNTFVLFSFHTPHLANNLGCLWHELQRGTKRTTIWHVLNRVTSVHLPSKILPNLTRVPPISSSSLPQPGNHQLVSARMIGPKASVSNHHNIVLLQPSLSFPFEFGGVNFYLPLFSKIPHLSVVPQMF